MCWCLSIFVHLNKDLYLKYSYKKKNPKYFHFVKSWIIIQLFLNFRTSSWWLWSRRRPASWWRWRIWWALFSKKTKVRLHVQWWTKVYPSDLWRTSTKCSLFSSSTTGIGNWTTVYYYFLWGATPTTSNDHGEYSWSIPNNVQFSRYWYLYLWNIFLLGDYRSYYLVCWNSKHLKSILIYVKCLHK